MKKEEKIIKDVAKISEDMNLLTIDKIEDTPDKEPEIQTKLTHREMADELGVRYIEPKRKLGILGELPSNLEKQRARDWEYVKGIYENIDCIGEAVEFWYVLYPGDPDCLWSIPSNVPVFVPRFIAKHLEDVQKYHRFDYKNKNSAALQHGEFEDTFESVETVYRGKFRPIEAFA